MAAAIEVRDVSKRFRLYHERYSSLKERAVHFGRIPYEDFWAARDISFEEAQLLAKEREQEILREALARDLVALVMRRLAALQGDPALAP